MSASPPAETTSGEDSLARLHAGARALGFEFSAFGWCVPLPITRPRKLLYSNFPGAWQRHYDACGYIDIDPTLTHGMRSSESAVWDCEFFSTARQLWLDAQVHGLCHAFVQPRHELGGAYSTIVLARTHTPITTAELAGKERCIQLLAHMAHAKLRLLSKRRLCVPADVRLSEREAEVLRWTADGKTAEETATLIGMSERMVNNYLRAAAVKLDACNKTSTAVRAAMLGLLWGNL